MYEEIIKCDVTGEVVGGDNSSVMTEVDVKIPGSDRKVPSLNFHLHREFISSLIAGTGDTQPVGITVYYSGTTDELGEYFLGEPIGVEIDEQTARRETPYVLEPDTKEETEMLCDEIDQRLKEKGHKKEQ